MVKATKTINPLHFEDLEPHRFEDLVRQLAYDFKDWQSIEATGRSGSDEGYDIRAWEKSGEITNQSEDEENDEGGHPMEGKLWMIQCKREKVLGPKRVAEIINESIKGKPPYGFILSAPTNFSKKSYDIFRQELINKKVMEFHLWGRAELEDMLYMPKNDRILFTFFGFSLIVKKKSKVREVKFALNNKNKLIRILGDGEMYKSILIRDIDAEHYPFIGEYKDFKKKPRWSERTATGYHPLGLMFDLRKYHAYIDTEKKEFDFVKVDLIPKQKERDDKQDYDLKARINDFCEHIPKRNQGNFILEGLLHFEDMLIIDEKGDVVYDFPHIFVDNRAFRWTWEKIETGNTVIDLNKEKYKRIQFFPKVFPKRKVGKIHDDKVLDENKNNFKYYREGVDCWELFDIDGKYKDIKVRDFIPVKKETTDQYSHQEYLEVTFKYETTAKEIIRGEDYIKTHLEKQLGRAVKDADVITVLEVKLTYEWATQKDLNKGIN